MATAPVITVTVPSVPTRTSAPFKRTGAGDLGVDRQADADQTSLQATRTLCLAQLCVVQNLQGGLQRPGKIATVEADRPVHRLQAGVKRHRFRRDQIATPDLGRIESQTLCGDVEQALARKRRLWLSSATVRGGGALVGDHRDRIDLQVGDAVGTRNRRGGERRIDEAEGSDVRAHVGHDPIAQPENRAVTTQRQLQLVHLLARVHHAEKMLAPVFDPFDCSTESTGGERGPADLPGRSPL